MQCIKAPVTYLFIYMHLKFISKDVVCCAIFICYNHAETKAFHSAGEQTSFFFTVSMKDKRRKTKKVI
jgi:hypothetical protein